MERQQEEPTTETPRCDAEPWEDLQFAADGKPNKSDEENQESTSEKHEKLTGNLQDPQCTKDTQPTPPDSKSRVENESTSEKCEEKLTENLQDPQCTKDTKPTPPDGENQVENEFTSEKHEEKLTGNLQDPQCTKDTKPTPPDGENQVENESPSEKRNDDGKSMVNEQQLQNIEGANWCQTDHESPSEKRSDAEKPKVNEQQSQNSEGANWCQTDHCKNDRTNERRRCDDKPMGPMQELPISEGANLSQPEKIKNESPSEKRSDDEKPMVNEQQSQNIEDANWCQTDHESPNEKRSNDEKPKVNEQLSQNTEGANWCQADHGKNDRTSERRRRDEKPEGPVHELPVSEGANLHQPEKGKNDRTSESRRRDEKPMGPVQELPISAGANLSQPENWKISMVSVSIGVVLVSLCVYYLSNFQSQQESEAVGKILNMFLQNFGQVRKSFPSQEEQLWKRSRIMLQKHVNMTMHSEPSILMFAAARDAEGTMRCLTSRIAGAYASAFNSGVMEIDGSGKKLLNSDELKLDLDNQLSSGFSEGKKSAVVHHFQDLPPPSTLLFYKYCDHENAAFKDVSLLITVLLDEQKLDPGLSFDVLEETVYDFLVMKFSISGKAGQYNILDTDKFSGLWSRIAHAILLVRPEKEIEENGCKHG
uniref:torsin-1A-interacting protein 2-like isoform X2 n=1 Tax=Pristiophorus japonicus TaxID=55135 RepID=UPI00398E8D6E